MATCQTCGEVVGALEIENGVCENCQQNGTGVERVLAENESVGDMNADLSSKLGNPFSFKGKIGRAGYFLYGILLGNGLLFAGFYLGLVLHNEWMMLLLMLVGIWIALAATVRRSRDRNESVFMMLVLSVIPYVGFLVMLYLLLMPGVKVKKETREEEDEV